MSCVPDSLMEWQNQGAALSDLRTLLTNGIDPNRGGGALFTAPLGRPDGTIAQQAELVTDRHILMGIYFNCARWY